MRSMAGRNCSLHSPPRAWSRCAGRRWAMASLICWCLRATNDCGRKFRSRIWRARRCGQPRCWTIWKAKPMRSPHRPSPSAISPSAARSLISISVLPNRIGASAICAFAPGMLLSPRGRRCRRRFPSTIRKRNNCGARSNFLLRMILSENRFPLFGIMRILFAHDLVRKPVPTFRDHALWCATRGRGMEFADKSAISELINAWGAYRDQAKWKELRGTFTPDGHISVSWFRGPFEQFVERCRTSFAASRGWSRHHLFTPRITLEKDRATAETPVVIRLRKNFGPVEADLTSFSRFLARVERQGGAWLIPERPAIYERDRLDPVEPSAAFGALFAAADTAHYPEQYRYMAFRLAHAEGRTLAAVVYRDGGPETADLYARYFRWLGGGAG